jgi:hypothetical protein
MPSTYNHNAYHKTKINEKSIMQQYVSEIFRLLFVSDLVSAGRRHTNGDELCPFSSRFIFMLIRVGVSSNAC